MDADARQGLAHFVELEGLDDCRHHFHSCISLLLPLQNDLLTETTKVLSLMFLPLNEAVPKL